MIYCKQTTDANLDGRKFFDFGFGNATGYYDIIDRPMFDHPGDDSSTDGAFPLVLPWPLLAAWF